MDCNVLHNIAIMITDIVGIFTCLWIIFACFGVDMLEYIFEKFNRYNFKEIFLYAFTFSILATMLYDLLRDYKGIDGDSLGIYFVFHCLLLIFTVIYVWKKYQERSIPDMLVSLISILVVVIVIKWITKDIQNYFPEAFLFISILMYLAFKKYTKIKTNEWAFFIYALGFTSLILLINEFLCPNNSGAFVKVENCIYFIIIAITFVFYVSNIKNRDFLKQGILPLFLGGLTSMFVIELVKEFAQEVMR